ncbi:MAG: SUMF1/EgtB/PvdO family nonheme iron enzyme [Candidatus Scalindua sp.]|nr:SUMF1/EgtB/PvdO family nonheme iron enzyme [Candidatus Scalindua sp.]
MPRYNLKCGQGRIVLRGGSWNNNSDNCRCANRNNNEPNNRNNNVGFRCASTRVCGETLAQSRSPFLHGERECAVIESRPRSRVGYLMVYEQIMNLFPWG